MDIALNTLIDYMYDELKSADELIDEDLSIDENYALFTTHIYFSLQMLKYKGDEKEVKKWFVKRLLSHL